MTLKYPVGFHDLQLSQPVFRAISDVGYETPSPIQAQTIPIMLDGLDIVGQAQTGTGKTAAFALPLLSRLDLSIQPVQVLVLTPTRELAIQVAEAFQKYAKYIKGFHVLPIYGGQDYRTQLRALQRGVNVVVGTPGRVMDHMRRRTLRLDKLTTLVLDEADEMLRMGFIDDVEWILDKTPAKRQIALFSATMPAQIRHIASKYLHTPQHISVKSTTSTASTIRQRYWNVSGARKLEALTRILEVELFDAMLVFVRTKTSTIELAEKLEARGYACAALNGDIVQSQRERTVKALRERKIDIVVATDVAARGLDVPRISHVVNYDIPTDIEAYIHRIGRTGRAGRHGDAILFVAPRERRLRHAIEKATGKIIEPMDLPSNELINERRIARFKQRITDTLEFDNISFFEEIIESYHRERNVPYASIAAALAQLVQGDTPIRFPGKPLHKTKNTDDLRNSDKKNRITDRIELSSKQRSRQQPANHAELRSDRFNKPVKKEHRKESQHQSMRPTKQGMERFRLEVGSVNGAKPGNIVGAIANEAGIDSQYIDQISIATDHSLVDLPEGMPKEIFLDLKKTRVCGVAIKISRLGHNKSKNVDPGKPAKPKKTKHKKPNTAATRKAKAKLRKKRKTNRMNKGKRAERID